jgi:protein involved in polysaccharide export with SLBB domain
MVTDETQVSLSADTINGILKNEPGLLLQVKRMLAKKAAEQGRVLYVNELTDETTYQLIENSPVIRALVTQEMADRGYLTVRPTEQEVREKERQKQVADANAKRQNLAIEREDQLLRQAATARIDQSQGPREAPVPVESDVDTSAPIRPDQLPGLLSTGLSGQGAGAMGAGRLGAASLSSGAGFGAGGLSSAGGLGGLGSGGVSLPSDIQDGRNAPAPRTQQVATIPRRPAMVESQQPSPVDRSMIYRANPYANVPSLYDLYAQARPASGPLQRFGADIFRNGAGNLNELPMDLPVGPEYILGPGDGLKVELSGSVSQRLQRVVDREGRVALPEVGTIQVAGRSMGDVQREVQTVLRTQFRDVRADLSLNRIRSVRVYVVGDVANPGAYDISSLSTPLNAVYAAGGPTVNGSMRQVRHLRNRNVVEQVDLYDLLLNGTRSDLQSLQPGDTILVPPVGPQVAVEGMVRRPAVYEVGNDATLAEVLQLAGGVLPSGTLRTIDVERLQAHESRTMLRLNLPESNDPAAVDQRLTEFRVQDGDRIRISPILPYSQKTVYLDGHVFRPGKYPYTDGMKVTDLIQGYSDLLPEPSERHAEIIRLQAPDFRPVVMAFNLGDALAGRIDPPALQPFDTVRVFGRYDFEDPPVIVVGGEVRDPGEHRTNGEVHLRDAIYLAGGVTPDALLSDAQVFRRNSDGSMKIFDLNLASALAGDPKANLLILSRDRIIVHRNLEKLDPPTVSVEGEVASPGRYPLGAGMTASELVRAAGGLKRSAFSEAADLSRYLVQNDKKILGEHQELAIAKALSGDSSADIALRDGDVLTIRRIGGWDDIGAGVTIAGEVLHPGKYGIQEGEHLSSVLKRAGGFRTTAYPYGAVLERVQVKELGEKARQDMISRIEAGQGLSGVKVGLSASAGEQAAVVQAAAAQQQQVLAGLKAQPASGRMVINISDNVSRWEGTSDDIELRSGDVITIPKRPNFVLVSGQVYNASAITYREGKDAEWYLKQSGGVTSLANKKGIFIIRANGSIIGEGSSSGWWGGSVLSTRLRPGDTVMVPERILTGSPWLRDLLTSAQLASSLALSAGVIANF